MTIQLIVLIIALAVIIFFFKNFNACVYFIVMTDIFLRLITYLKIHILRDDAFSFLEYIPSDIPTIINSFDIGTLSSILMGLYIIIYIIFEVLLIGIFIKKRF